MIGDLNHDGVVDEKDLAKAWYKSRTIIFNIAVAVITGLGSLIHEQVVADFFKEYYPQVLMGVTIANIYLRTITTKPVE